VVLEDVVTTGQSAMSAVERLKQAGYNVNQVIALVDRQQGGDELYQSVGLKFQSIFSIQDIKRCFGSRGAHAPCRSLGSYFLG
jgi:orotate phosphoribosyltransferase